MSLNHNDGKMIAIIRNPLKSNKVLLVDQKPNRGPRKITLSTRCKFEPTFDPDARAITYICGASGSGKSTLARSLIQTFHILFPKSPVYMFSRLSTDPAFDDLEEKGIILRIKIDERLINEPIDVTNDIEHGSLVVFDDIDTINDKKLIAALNNVKLQILEIGRHNKIYCIVTSHLINTNDRNSTRTMMNEMSNLVIFPRGGGSAYQQRYALKNYLGLPNAEIDKILSTSDSRWVLISKNYPQYILTEKKCYLL